MTTDDTLQAAGVLTLGDDPPAEAVGVVVDRLGELVRGADAGELRDVRAGAWRVLEPLGVTGDDLDGALGIRRNGRTEPAGEGEWPDAPDVPGTATPDPMPVDALPPTLRAEVESVAQGLQVPPALPMMLGLGTLSATVAGKIEVEVRTGWREPLNLYTACILPPASRKSPAYATITEALRAWESERVMQAAPAVLAAQDVVEVAEKRLERAKSDAAKGNAGPEDVEAARLELEGARAKVPPDGRLLAGDITPEAMVVRMAEQGGRLAILEPEPGPLQLLAGRYSDTARLDEVKKSWSGETLTVDRVGRAPLRVERPALTLGLCLQPGVLEALQNGDAFRHEGLLGRILWCQPPHGLGTRRTGADVPPLDRDAHRRLSRIVRMLAEVEPENCPQIIRMSSDALKVLHEYEAEIEAELADGARCAPIRDWAGKAVGQAVRVAALLELARRAEEGTPVLADISSWAMESARKILRALTSHALAVLGPTDRHEALVAHVLQRAVDMVADDPPPAKDGGPSLRNLYERTKGKRAIESMQDLREIVGDLEDRGCLRLDYRPSTGGRPPSPFVEIHPALAESIRKSRTSTSPTSPEGASANTAKVSGDSADELSDPLEAMQGARDDVPAVDDVLGPEVGP